jgi:hypothetical protein
MSLLKEYTFLTSLLKGVLFPHEFVEEVVRPLNSVEGVVILFCRLKEVYSS